MHRLFLDANVLFSAAYRPGAGLLKFWKLPNTVLCSSRYALEEARVNLSTESQVRTLARLSQALHLFESSNNQLPVGISLAQKDVPISLAAVAARASHLITGDLRHFGPYLGKRPASILVLLPADYLRNLE